MTLAATPPPADEIETMACEILAVPEAGPPRKTSSCRWPGFKARPRRSNGSGSSRSTRPRRHDAAVDLAGRDHGFGARCRAVADQSLHRAEIRLGHSAWPSPPASCPTPSGRRFVKIGLAKTPMTILENNCMQSTASSAGYSTGGTLISAFAAYIMLNGHPLARCRSCSPGCSSWRFSA